MVFPGSVLRSMSHRRVPSRKTSRNCEPPYSRHLSLVHFVPGWIESTQAPDYWSACHAKLRALG